MSCRECEIAQQEESTVYYYRWKNANVVILSCKEHFLEIRDALNAKQSEGK